MGLDMYLYHSPKGTASPDLGPYPEVADFSTVSRKGWAATNELCYWRKANAVHRFFVEKCAHGIDDCNPVKVHPEILADLYSRCAEVLKDHSLAPELLPAQAGFFFGTTDYDEWYFADLKETVEMLDTNILHNPAIRGHDLYYLASW